MDRIPQDVFWIYGCSWKTCHLLPVSGQWKCKHLSAQATELPCTIIQRLPSFERIVSNNRKQKGGQIHSKGYQTSVLELLQSLIKQTPSKAWSDDI